MLPDLLIDCSLASRDERSSMVFHDLQRDYAKKPVGLRDVCGESSKRNANGLRLDVRGNHPFRHEFFNQR
jgi:hypothetical protein